LITNWCRSYFNDLHPYSAGGAYVNFMMEEGDERIRATYGDNYNRLAAIKARYDPDNFFRVNQNIKPARAVETAYEGGSASALPPAFQPARRAEARRQPGRAAPLYNMVLSFA